MEDYQLSAGIEPAKRVKLEADLHLFQLASARDAWYWCSGKPMRRDPSGHAGRKLGSEVDIICTWGIGRNLELMAGYGHFFPGTFIGNTGSDDHADWVFSQITWKF